MSFLAKNLLTWSCQVKQAGRKSWGYRWNGQFRLQFGSEWNQLPFQRSQYFCFSPLHLLCKVCFTAQWGGLHWWWERGFLSQACQASHLHSPPVSEKNFSGVRTGNPWTVTFENRVRKCCYLQVWERTALSGSSVLPAQLWRELQDKQEPPRRAMLHIKWPLESMRKHKSSSS